MSCIRVVRSTPFTLPFDLFANINKIGKVTAPVYIFHGQSDDVIHVSHGQTLKNLCKSTIQMDWWPEDDDHCSLENNPDFYPKLQTFLEMCI